MAAAFAMAEEALGIALVSYPLRGLPAPKAEAAAAGARAY